MTPTPLLSPRRRAVAGAVAASLAAGLLAVSAPPVRSQEGGRVLEAAGVRFRWRVVAEALEGTLEGPGPGWVLVGFNEAGGGLEGARLLFFALRSDGVARAEEHLAAPPRHHPVADRPRVRVLRAEPVGTAHRFTFRVPLAPPAGSRLRLRPGRRFDVILAYSASPDFDHHSRRREHVTVRL